MANIDLKGDFLDGPELRLLTKIYGGDRQKAIGVVVEFWEVAQRYWVKGQLIPEQAFSFHGFPKELLDIGIELAERREGGIYAKGSDRFEWIKQRREAGRLGGKASAEARNQFARENLLKKVHHADPKKDAQYKLSRAVALGMVRRPEACEKCGALGIIHGHHFDYSKPIEVSWLCAKCHSGEHQVNPNVFMPSNEAGLKQNEPSLQQAQPPVPVPVPFPGPKKEDRIGDAQKYAVHHSLSAVAEIFAGRKIPAELQAIWLETYTAEFIVQKVKALKAWELTAGAKGRKSNWGRFYSNCFASDWDKYSRGLPSAKAPEKLHPMAIKHREQQK